MFRGPRRRLPTFAAVSAGVSAAVSVAIIVGGLAGILIIDRHLSRAGRPDLSLMDSGGWVFVVAAVTSTAVGATLVVRRPGHPVGWCFTGLGLSIVLCALLGGYGAWGSLVHPGHPAVAGVAATVSNVLFIVWLVLVGLVCYLTPTGRSLSPAFGWCARALVVAGALWLVGGLVSPEPMDPPVSAVSNPWAVHAWRAPLGALRTVVAIATNALLLVGAASLVVRFRRAAGDERRQLLWMAVAAVPLPVLVALTFAAARADNDQLLGVGAATEVVILPVAAALAITRYHLYDVERILHRAVSYLLVSAVLAALYAAVVVFVTNGVGQAAGRSRAGVALAALAVATAARPVHRVVQDSVDRRFSRRRFDALTMIRRFVAAPNPETGVEQVLRAAAGDPTLTVAYWVPDRGQWVTADGHPAVPAPDALAVTRAGRPVARVSFDTERVERRLVEAVAHEAEPELDNAGLRAAIALQLEEVRASRSRIATAQFDERRRIERALHDGAQQRLLALAAQQQAALLNGDPQRLRAALTTGVAESRVAVRELRELANGLHPSVLSDGGLTSAFDDLATRLPVRVEIREPGRRFPHHVEAATWFVACEAVTNAVKHADAARITLTLDTLTLDTGTGTGTGNDTDAGIGTEELRLTVDDDGCGGADPDGQGLRGIADRVAAVRGRLSIECGHAGGTVVRAVLPCGS